MIRRVKGVMLGLACLAPGSPTVARAQVWQAEPSSLVTIPAGVPADIADAAVRGDSVVYAIRAGEGFRAVSAPRGLLDLRASELPVMPITIGVGPDVEAGQHVAVVIEFIAPGIVDSVVIRLHVEAHHGLTVSLASEDHAHPGSRLRVRYEVTNTGNVADSVYLKFETQVGRVRGKPASLHLPAFATRRGVFEIDVALDLDPGPALVVVKALAGDSVLGFGSLEVPIGFGDDGWLASLVRVPTRVFVGSSVRTGSVGEAGSSFGIQAAGELRPGLRLSVAAHQAPSGTSVFAFRGLQFGPRFRAQLASRSFVLGAGDVASRTARFTGYQLQGRGGTVEWGSGLVRLFAHAARPTGEDGATEAGNQLAGGLDIRTPFVVVGLHGLHERRAAELQAPAQEMRSAYIRLEPVRPSAHGYLLEAGWLGLRNISTGIRAQAPAISGRYFYRKGSTLLDVVLRRHPAVSGLSRGANELRLDGRTEIIRGVGVLGGFREQENPSNPVAGARRTKQAEAGVFVSQGANRFELRGRFRRTEGDRTIEERTVLAVVEAEAGPGSIDARVEVGQTRSQGRRDRVFRTVAGYNLRGRRGWGRIGLSYRRDSLYTDGVSVDLTGSYRMSDLIEIYGSAATTLDGIDDARAVRVQVGLEFDLRPDFSLFAGVETVQADDIRGSDVRFSVGVRKGLPVPVPFPRRRSVRGVVFTDIDGDGNLGPGEPMLDGVRVTMGGTTVTTRRGQFSFAAETPRAHVHVEISSLGDGYIPVSPIAASGGVNLMIPVHRAASLRIEAFLDADRDGVRDPTEPPLRDLAVVVSTSSASWTLRTAEDGSAELPAIRPGIYAVSVDPASLPRRAEVPGLLSMTLVGGETGTVFLAVPARSVTFSGDLSSEAGNPREEPGDGGI